LKPVAFLGNVTGDAIHPRFCLLGTQHDRSRSQSS
jgi:hypothetical protein